jgi:hypothetical protein
MPFLGTVAFQLLKYTTNIYSFTTALSYVNPQKGAESPYAAKRA